MANITQSGDTINGIVPGDVFEVTIVIENTNGVYSLVSQSINVFRGNNNIIYTLTIPDNITQSNTMNSQNVGTNGATNGVTNGVTNGMSNGGTNGVPNGVPQVFPGGDIHSSHIYQPKTPKRKIRKISNKTLRKKQQLTTRH
jgi:hypothetical protein